MLVLHSALTQSQNLPVRNGNYNIFHFAKDCTPGCCFQYTSTVCLVGVFKDSSGCVSVMLVIRPTLSLKTFQLGTGNYNTDRLPTQHLSLWWRRGFGSPHSSWHDSMCATSQAPVLTYVFLKSSVFCTLTFPSCAILPFSLLVSFPDFFVWLLISIARYPTLTVIQTPSSSRNFNNFDLKSLLHAIGMLFSSFPSSVKWQLQLRLSQLILKLASNLRHCPSKRLDAWPISSTQPFSSSGGHHFRTSVTVTESCKTIPRCGQLRWNPSSPFSGGAENTRTVVLWEFATGNQCASLRPIQLFQLTLPERSGQVNHQRDRTFIHLLHVVAVLSISTKAFNAILSATIPPCCSVPLDCASFLHSWTIGTLNHTHHRMSVGYMAIDLRDGLQCSMTTLTNFGISKTIILPQVVHVADPANGTTWTKRTICSQSPALPL